MVLFLTPKYETNPPFYVCRGCKAEGWEISRIESSEQSRHVMP